MRPLEFDFAPPSQGQCVRNGIAAKDLPYEDFKATFGGELEHSVSKSILALIHRRHQSPSRHFANRIVYGEEGLPSVRANRQKHGEGESQDIDKGSPLWWRIQEIETGCIWLCLGSVLETH